MKKLFLVSIILIFTATLLCVTSVFAAPKPYDATNAKIETLEEAFKELNTFPKEMQTIPLTAGPGEETVDDRVHSLIGKGIKITLGIIGSISLVIFVFSGIMWMISEGNAEKVVKAEKSMIWAALGLFVIFISYALVDYIINNIKF